MPMITQPILAAHDLSVELGGIPVVRGVNLTLGAAETVALMGSNGSGKSTLVRALLGLTPIQRGEVTLFGTPLTRFRDWARIGYVPQRSTVGLAGAKVKEVVSAGRLARRASFFPPSRADRAAAAAALAAVGLTDRAEDAMASLSGGQSQRVLIARALAGEPDLLILDEPTAGVDREHQQILAATLAELHGRGVAILVVLHELGTLADLLRRAIVLRDGRVGYDGEFAALSAQGDPLGGHEHEPPPVAGRLLDGTVER